MDHKNVTITLGQDQWNSTSPLALNPEPSSPPKTKKQH